MQFFRTVSLALVLAACAPDESSDSALSRGSGSNSGDGNVAGAIFTTTVDGTRVDANIYGAKEDVYLDGGPGANAPPSAAALPDGDYYFEVTDPSGHTVLSSDDIECRRIRFSGGLITEVFRGPNVCLHGSGSDANDGGLTVQLMPYADTPNPGGEYKVWVTPIDKYDGAFSHRYSKTDNFKVRSTVTPPPPQDGGVTPPPPDAGEAPPDAPCDAASHT